MAKDREFPNSQKQISDGVLGLASPKDRLAAYILDCTLLLPLVQILQSPFKKWILESALFDNGAQVSTYRFFNLLIFILLFIFYYAFMIWWRGQTLGKMFFGLKVISYHGALTLSDSFMRSVFIFFEFLCLGIPFLAIFTHPMRRPGHDRVSDTLVISDKNAVGFPTRREKFRAQVVGASFGVLAFVFALSYAHFDLSVPAEEGLCEEAVARVDSNLEKLVELNIINEISNECLFREARAKIWAEEESALAQFALASSYRDELDKSNEYLSAVCESNQNDHLCDLSRWLQGNQNESELGVENLLEKIKGKKIRNFVRVFVAARLNEKKSYQGAEAVLKPIAQAGILQPVVAALTFHSLVGQLKWDEAYWVFRTHENVNDDSLLYFMQLELKKSRMSVKQQVELLDYFYPSLGDRSSRREPASVDRIPGEIRDIYRILEARL